MTPEEIQPLLIAAAEWSAKEQSSLNTVLLGLIFALVGWIGLDMRTRAKKALDQIDQTLEEIHNIKIDVARHDEAIDALQHKRR